MSSILTNERRGFDAPVNEYVIMPELQDEVDELFLYLKSRVFVRTRTILEDGDRVDGLTIHLSDDLLLQINDYDDLLSTVFGSSESRYLQRG